MVLPVLFAGWLPESLVTARLEKPPWAQLDPVSVPVSLDDQGPRSPHVLSPLGLALTRQLVRTKVPQVRDRRGFRSLVCPRVLLPASGGCLPARSSIGSLLVTACLSAVLETQSGRFSMMQTWLSRVWLGVGWSSLKGRRGCRVTPARVPGRRL